MTSLSAVRAAARAVVALDAASFSRPETGPDAADWLKARTLLLGIITRRGYELAAPGSARVRKTRSPAARRPPLRIVPRD